MPGLKVKITTEGIEETSAALKVLAKNIDKAIASLEKFNKLAKKTGIKVKISVDKVGVVSHEEVEIIPTDRDRRICEKLHVRGGMEEVCQ